MIIVRDWVRHVPGRTFYKSPFNIHMAVIAIVVPVKCDVSAAVVFRGGFWLVV